MPAKAHFRVLRKSIAHAKLYLLSGRDGRRRVVIGSANLSEQAFSGNQPETLVVFDNDEAAWNHYNRMFDEIRDSASDEVPLPEERITNCEGRRDNVPPGRSSAEVWRLKTVPPVAFNQERPNLTEGGLDVQGGDVTVAFTRGSVLRKMLKYSVPPGYQRDGRPPSRPKLDPYKGVIDQILEEDQGVPRSGPLCLKRIYERLRDEHGSDVVRYTTRPFGTHDRTVRKMLAKSSSLGANSTSSQA